MSSNLDAIVEGVAAQLRTIPDLAAVITYEPDQPGALPMVYLDMERWDYPPKTYGEMCLGWDLIGMLVLAPVTAKASAAAALAHTIIPQIIRVMGLDLHAHGAIRDGQVLLTVGEKGRLRLGGTEWYARRLTFRAIERIPYEYSYATGAAYGLETFQRAPQLPPR